MGCKIISDKQSVRLDKDNYMSFQFSGDSSLTDEYTGAVLKSWAAVLLDGFAVPWGTKNQLNEYCQVARAKYAQREGYSDAGFGGFLGMSIGGRKTYKTTFGQFKGLYVGATKKAITVSALRELCGVQIKLSVCSWFANDNDIEMRVGYPKSGKELMSMYKDYATNPHNNDEPVPVFITLVGRADKNLAKDIRTTFFTKQPELKSPSFVVLMGLGEFVKDDHAGYLTYTKKRPSPDSSFADKGQGLKFMQRCKANHPEHSFHLLTYKKSA